MSELASSGQLRMAFVRWALFTVPLIVALGFASGSLSNTGSGNRWYNALQKPAFQPPDWAFPVAWSLLYVMLGLALAMVLNARGSRWRSLAVGLFIVAFVFNLLWSPVFFGMHLLTMGLVVIVLMLTFTVATTIAFARVRPTAALLLVPYIGWLCFATALNYEIRRLNPDADGLVVDRAGSQIDLVR